MPSQVHEVFVDMFRTDPELAAGLLADVFDIELPDYRDARASSCDFTDVSPTEFRGDTALVFADAAGVPVLGIIVEVQLRKDHSRQWSWPVYLATLRARLRCPTYLMVFCPDRGVAAWSGRPIDLGHPGMILRPLVLGPEIIPAVTDPEFAKAAPERAVLSAIAHADGPNSAEVFESLAAGLDKAADDVGKMYYDLVLALLSPAARHRLEEYMKTVAAKYEYQSDFARKYVAEGRAEGRAEAHAEAVAARVDALLTVLEVRWGTIPGDVRARVAASTDLNQLKAWTERAKTANSSDELFADR
ncbi:hypothetical protein [Nocardia cyriacigeorgica]|nr:hypothetical protein [Nocardia cyriacigeorgica]